MNRGTYRKFLRVASAVICALSLTAFLSFSIYGMYGLAGSDPQNWQLMFAGFALVIVSSAVSIWHTRWTPLIGVGVVLIAVGMIRNDRFWESENAALCAKLRSNHTCTESDTGFSCTDFDGRGTVFVTGKSVCSNVPPAYSRIPPDQAIE